MSDFEPALAVRSRVREGAANVAEHLALEQGRRDPSEVHLHERPGAAGAVAVDCIRHQLLPGAAVASYEHRRVGSRDAPHQVQDAQELGVLADQVAEVVARVELLACESGCRCPARRELRRLGQAKRRADGVKKLLVRPRLGDEVGCAGLHPFDRQRDGSPRCHQDHGEVGVRLSDRPDETQALFACRLAREVHVLEHEPALVARQPRKRLPGRAGRLRSVACLLQQQGQRRGHRRVVVYHQDHGAVRALDVSPIRTAARRREAPPSQADWGTPRRGQSQDRLPQPKRQGRQRRRRGR